MSDAKPSPMPTPDLAGILSRSTRTTPKPAFTESSSPQAARNESAQQSTSREDMPARKSKPQPSLRAVADSKARPGQAVPRQYLRPIVVYMPRDTHRQLHATATQRGTTATALTLQAVNATHDRLADAVIAQQETQSEEDGDLFDVPQARPATQLSVQTSIRVTDAQYQALTDLAASLMINRSQMISTAVRLYLDAPTTA